MTVIKSVCGLVSIMFVSFSVIAETFFIKESNFFVDMIILVIGTILYMIAHSNTKEVKT